MEQSTVDHVIIGAGIAGMTLQHALGEASTVLIDSSPGRYKIGESIIPQHFLEPELQPLLEVVRALPSAAPKQGTLFVSEDSVGAFEVFPEASYAVHVWRQDLEEATARFFGTRVVHAHVQDVDLEQRIVTTNQGVFRARELIADCSGAARVVARKLGILKEVWPVWAAWAYHDVVDTDDERLLGMLRDGTKRLFRFDDRDRVLREGRDCDDLCPSQCTILTQIRRGVWTWQIPLWRGRILSVGVVSREGPVELSEYAALAEASIAPHLTTRMRVLDKSGPRNRFHVRNRFAWAAERYAGDSWALLGDAAFFGDPVYSVGTGFATNHALQLGRALRQKGWTPKVQATHQTLTADLFKRAKQAYDHWYQGGVLDDASLADEVQTGFLNGRAFQVQTIGAYREMWLVSHPQDTRNALSPRHGEDVSARVSALFSGGSIGWWQLAGARAFSERVELEWKRSDGRALVITIEKLEPGRPAYLALQGMGMSYRPPPAGELDQEGVALLSRVADVFRAELSFFRALLDGEHARGR